MIKTTSKNYLMINSINLENREQRITSILITLRNNPSLTAKIVKSYSKKVTQNYMDFLIANFYDPLQPKSCTCKSSMMIYEFIKEVFISETRYIDNINDLVDNCPLLFKMVISLFNKVQLFDFLAVFLKKLLKKKYLKEIVNQQNIESRERNITENIKLVDSEVLEPNHVISQNQQFDYFGKLQSQNLHYDFTSNVNKRRIVKNKQYKNLIKDKIGGKRDVSKRNLDGSFMVTNSDMFGDQENKSLISKMKIFNKQIIDKAEYESSTTHNKSYFGNSIKYTEGKSKIFETQLFSNDKFITIDNGHEINKDMMKEVMISLINAIRTSFPNEIKFLFYLFKEFCDRKKISNGAIINIFFFQKFLITKCSLDNFHEVIH